MSDSHDYANGTDLSSTLRELRQVRDRLKAVEQPPSPEEFFGLVRGRSPDIPDPPNRRFAADHPDKLPWPDNCGEWLNVALACFAGAVDSYDSGDRNNGAFHVAEGSYALAQAGACLDLGF